MNWKTILVVASTLVGGACLGQTADVANQSVGSDSDFSIRVTPAGRMKLSSPIEIAVVVTNISNRELYWRAEHGNTSYKALRVLLTKDRRELETTFLHRKVTGRLRSDDDPIEALGGAGTSVVSVFPPGKSITLTIDLQRLYKISDPGEYTLEISCASCRSDDSDKPVVRAKPLTLKIVR